MLLYPILLFVICVKLTEGPYATLSGDKSDKLVMLALKNDALVADKLTIEAVLMQAFINDTFVADTFTIEAVVMQALRNDTFVAHTFTIDAAVMQAL